jgi:hypothetical protein
MMLQRPGKDNNVMVMQAYKKTMVTCNAPPIPQNGGVKKKIPKNEVKCKPKLQGGSSNNRIVDLDEGIIIPLNNQINNRPSATAASSSNVGGKKSASSSFYQSNYSSEVTVNGGAGIC